MIGSGQPTPHGGKYPGLGLYGEIGEAGITSGVVQGTQPPVELGMPPSTPYGGNGLYGGIAEVGITPGVGHGTQPTVALAPPPG